MGWGGNISLGQGKILHFAVELKKVMFHYIKVEIIMRVSAGEMMCVMEVNGERREGCVVRKGRNDESPLGGLALQEKPIKKWM